MTWVKVSVSMTMEWSNIKNRRAAVCVHRPVVFGTIELIDVERNASSHQFRGDLKRSVTIHKTSNRVGFQTIS